MQMTSRRILTDMEHSTHALSRSGSTDSDGKSADSIVKMSYEMWFVCRKWSAYISCTKFCSKMWDGGKSSSLSVLISSTRHSPGHEIKCEHIKTACKALETLHSFFLLHFTFAKEGVLAHRTQYEELVRDPLSICISLLDWKLANLFAR